MTRGKWRREGLRGLWRKSQRKASRQAGVCRGLSCSGQGLACASLRLSLPQGLGEALVSGPPPAQHGERAPQAPQAPPRRLQRPRGLGRGQALGLSASKDKGGSWGQTPQTCS